MSLASSLIQKFDKNLKDNILGSANICKETFNKFPEKEKKDSVKVLIDLLDLKSKSESQVYEVLNTMVKILNFLCIVVQIIFAIISIFKVGSKKQKIQKNKTGSHIYMHICIMFIKLY